MAFQNQFFNAAQEAKKQFQQLVQNKVVKPVQTVWGGLQAQAKNYLPQHAPPTPPKVPSQQVWSTLKSEANNFMATTARAMQPITSNVARAGNYIVNKPFEAIGTQMRSANAQLPKNFTTTQRAGSFLNPFNEKNAFSITAQNLPGISTLRSGLKAVDQTQNIKDFNEAGRLFTSGKITKDEYIARSNKSMLPVVMGMTSAPVSITKRGFTKAGEILRKTAVRGSYTNVPSIDNPLLTKKTYETLRSSAHNIKNPRFLDEVSRVQKAIEPKIQTPVTKKVNALDYFRTPDRVLEKIGLKGEGQFLRKQWDKYVDELPKEINKVSGWAKQVPGRQSSERIFRFLDGQGQQLDPKELKVATEIKGYLSEWANKLGLPKEKRITDYITHIFEKDFVKKEFDEDLAKLITDKVPSSVYNPFTQQRLGKMGYVEDTWRALDAYVKRATRTYNMSPALKKIQERSVDLEASQLDYITKYTARINLRPTEIDNLVDNLIKSSPIGYKLGSRPITTITRTGRQAVYRGTLGLNPTTAVKNLTQIANTFSRLGTKYTAKGYMSMVKNWSTGELERVGVLADNINQDRQLTVAKRFIEKADRGLFYLFERAEKINRGAAYFGKKAQALDKGLNEQQAIEAAKKVVRDAQFKFSSIDTPLAMSSDISKTFTQFQSFSLKQSEFLGEMISKKDFAGLIRWLGSSLVMIHTVGKTIGMEPKDLIPNFRFGAPPTLAAPIEAVKALANTPDKYGQQRSTEDKLRDVGKTLVPFVPGGTQLKKTFEAGKAMSEGGSFTPSGQLRFEVPPSVKPLIFGIWNTKEAQDYLKKRQGEATTDVMKSAQEFERAETEGTNEEKKLGGKMYLQLKKLETVEERKALLQTWDQQGLLTNGTTSVIKSLSKKSKTSAFGEFPQAVGIINTNDGKARFIKVYFKGKSVEEKTRYLQELQKAGMLTPDLIKKLKAAAAPQ